MNRIVVLPYDSIWQHLFIDEQRKIKLAIKERVDIRHIGSTAVPGMHAKPIIDMMLICKNLQLFERKHQVLVALGYERVTPEFKDSLQYVKRIGGDRTHQLYIFQNQHQKIKEMLAFSAYLKYFSSEMERFNAVKRELAKLYPFDLKAYEQAKLIFVTVMTVKAVNWFETHETQKIQPMI